MKKNRFWALLLALVLLVSSSMPSFASEVVAETVAVETVAEETETVAEETEVVAEETMEVMEDVEEGETLELSGETEVDATLPLDNFLSGMDHKQPTAEEMNAKLAKLQEQYPDAPVVVDEEIGVITEPSSEELLTDMAATRASYGLVYPSMDLYGQGFVRGTTAVIPLTLFSLGYTTYYYVYIVDADYDIIARYEGRFSSSMGTYEKTLEWDISSTRATGEYYIVTYEGGEIQAEIPIYITSGTIPATALVCDQEGELVLDKGETQQVAVLPSPAGATTPRNMVWTSSDTSVAVIQNLDSMPLNTQKEIKAVGYGSCVITIALGNLKHSFTVYVPDPNCPFKDVSSGKWYYNAVKWAYSNGYITGTSDTTFSPNDPMTRGMLVTVLYRAEGRPSASAKTQFPDVDSSKYYAKAISWASKENLVSGYSNGNFGPEDSITREQIAKILYRYAEYCGYDVSASASLASFDDDEAVSSYAVKYMKWAVAEGFIQGSNNKLNPKGNATRAEIAAILKRFVEKY